VPGSEPLIALIVDENGSYVPRSAAFISALSVVCPIVSIAYIARETMMVRNKHSIIHNHRKVCANYHF